jgi:hypothetical protein
MARREKDRLYYEITKEKPFGSFQMLLVGGSAGSVTGFLIASLVGAYEGMEIDALVLVFLVSSFLGFFFGAILMWLCLRYFGKLIDDIPLAGEVAPSGPVEETSESFVSAEKNMVTENEEEKGKSVDFVFPELSPDKQ